MLAAHTGRIETMPMNRDPNRETEYTANRLGFHYYPDTLHYRDLDLTTWLPELTALGAGWLVVHSEAERAIPESFIKGLISAGIEPIVRFTFPLSVPTPPEAIRTILEAYARWKVRYVVFFDRPNLRSAWSTSAWAQQDLVERFLDRFIPLASLAVDLGLTPVMPPLQPGGDFWDTAFLRAALQSLERRKQQKLIDKLTLSAYAWTQGHSLNYGAGGPERWPEARPYFLPPDQEDQRGFRIHDWYVDIAQAVLLKRCPVILFQAGAEVDPQQMTGRALPENDESLFSVAALLKGANAPDPTNPEEMVEPLGNEVLCGNFWLLAAAEDSPFAEQAWFPPDQHPQPIVTQLREFAISQTAVVVNPGLNSRKTIRGAHLIERYLLLPTYSWGVADWHWNVIQPYVKKYRATVGYSLQEAALAKYVVVIGGEDGFSEDDLRWLRQSGCRVERINGDGTYIATQLAER